MDGVPLILFSGEKENMQPLGAKQIFGMHNFASILSEKTGIPTHIRINLGSRDIITVSLVESTVSN